MQQIHWQNGKLNLQNRTYESRTSLLSKPFTAVPLSISTRGFVSTKWVDTMFAQFNGGFGYILDGSLINVHATTTFGSQVVPDGSDVLLRLREGAPLIRINLVHPRVERANYEPVTAFHGRADILCAQEAIDLGYSISGGLCARMADEETMARLLDITELSPAVELEHGGMETVLTEQGEKRVEVFEPQRRMRFRRSR